MKYNKCIGVAIVSLLILFINYFLIERTVEIRRIQLWRFNKTFLFSEETYNLSQTNTIVNYSLVNQTLLRNNEIINTTTFITTSTTMMPKTIDPALVLVERPPASSSSIQNITLAAFIFHTRHAVLIDLQLSLIKRLARNLAAMEVFLDGPVSEEIRIIAQTHNAGVQSIPLDMTRKNVGASDRNGDLVNWALSTKGKEYLRNGSAVLLLDGDVFPLTPFDADTLLNSHDIVCRKHPATYSRFCWIGFICLAPQIYNTVDDFNVSPIVRRGSWHDAGGGTIEYFLKYTTTSFTWMNETILTENDKDLFWGTIYNDTAWIEKHFARCDKCGPELFVSPFNNSNIVFYHMISGASEWRFGGQNSRRLSLYNHFMQSPYGLNRTDGSRQELSVSSMLSSIQKVQKMPLIPFRGNLRCENICKTKIA